jgi:hypothetical protein
MTSADAFGWRSSPAPRAKGGKGNGGSKAPGNQSKNNRHGISHNTKAPLIFPQMRNAAALG